MRDLNDPVVREIARVAFGPTLTDLFRAIEKHFGTVKSWGNLGTSALTYNLESGGKVTIRVVVEAEGV